MPTRPTLASLALLAMLAAGCAQTPAPGQDAQPQLVIERTGTLPSPDGFAWEPSAAMNPLDGRNAIVAVKDGEAGLSVHSTHDAGVTWARYVQPVGAEAHEGSPEAAWSFTGDPVAWFGPDGTAYIGGLGRTVTRQGTVVASAEGADIFVAASTDGGRTFGPARIVAEGQGTIVSTGVDPLGEVLSVSTDLHNLDKPWFAAGPDGRLLAVWNDLGMDYYANGPMGVAPVPYDGNEMFASWSDDAGATWSEPTLVEPTSPRGPFPFFDADGSMHIAFSRWNDARLRVATWTGNGWSPVGLEEIDGQPVVARGGDGSAWLAAGLPDGSPALWHRTGGSWQGPARLGPAAEGDPRVNVAASGGVVWSSWYGPVEGRSHHVRVLLEGGEAVDLQLDQGLGGDDSQYGHYSNGLAAGPEGALVAWPAFGDGDGAFRFAWVRLA
jgi:hypothetical protein